MLFLAKYSDNIISHGCTYTSRVASVAFCEFGSKAFVTIFACDMGCSVGLCAVLLQSPTVQHVGH